MERTVVSQCSEQDEKFALEGMPRIITFKVKFDVKNNHWLCNVWQMQTRNRICNACVCSCKELDVVWEDVNLWGLRRLTSFLSFKELLSWITKNHQQPELFAITRWEIWSQQNQVRMHQPSCSPHFLAAFAKERLAEFILIQSAHNAPSP